MEELEDSESPKRELQNEWNARKSQFWKEGYREGLDEGIEASLQGSFNQGYSAGFEAGKQWGISRAQHASDLFLKPESAKDEDKAKDQQMAAVQSQKADVALELQQLKDRVKSREFDKLVSQSS